MKYLSGNKVKLIALISMTIDHIGRVFFPSLVIFEMIGRLSFPLFAYMIAEGWKYTSNRIRYFSIISVMGIFFQIIYYIMFSSLHMGVFIMYSLSLLFIYSIEFAISKKKYAFIFPLLTFLSIVLISGVEYIFPESSFAVDYGLIGILLPVAVYFSKTKIDKLCYMCVLLCVLCIVYGGVQFACLFSLIPLSYYNGGRGTFKL